MARWKPSVVPVVVPDDAALFEYKCRRVTCLVSDVELVTRFSLGSPEMRAQLDAIVRSVVAENPTVSVFELGRVVRARALIDFSEVS